MDNREMPYLVALAAAMCLSSFLSVAFFYGPSAYHYFDTTVSGYDAYLLLHGAAGDGYFQQAGWQGPRLLLTGGIALYYAIFGVSRLSLALFGISLAVATMGSIYAFGRGMHSRLAGLFAAVAFGMMPLSVLEASSAGDGAALSLFAVLAVGLLLLGSKRGLRRYYCVSGFVAGAAILADIQSVLMFPVLAAIFAYNVSRGREKDWRMMGISFVAGAVGAAVLAVILGYLVSGSYTAIFYAFTGRYATASYSQGAIASMTPGDNATNYLVELFPYYTVTALNLYAMLRNPLGYAYSAVLEPWTIDYNPGFIPIGYYGATMAVSIAYLAFRRERSVWILALWIGIGMGLLTYANIPGGLFLIFFNNWYIAMVTPAIALTIGIAFSEAFGSTASGAYKTMLNKVDGRRRMVKGGKMHWAAFTAACACMVLVLAQNFYAIRTGEYMQMETVYNMLEMAARLMQLPASSTVYVIATNATVTPYFNMPIVAAYAMSVYTNYRYNFQVVGLSASCSAPDPGSYYIYVNVPEQGGSLQFPGAALNDCGALHLLFNPQMPTWLDYTILGGGPFTGLTLYRA